MVSSYGINNQAMISDPMDQLLEELSISGYTLLKGVLTAEELEETRNRLDTINARQTERFGEERLKEIAELNMARCLLAEDPFFLKIATHERVLNAVKRILGEYFILHLQNGIINLPKQEHHQSSWHRDLPYQNFEISSPLAVGALFCIDPFNHETGGTFVVPFTQRLETLPSQGYIDKHKVQIEAEAGDVMLFDSMLLHKAGYNGSDIIRRGINNVYVKPFLKQQISLLSALGDDYTQDPFLRRFLGFESEVPQNVDAWRSARFNRKNSKS